jgi:Holliday junction resolvase RusA-like endonuclease
VSNFGNPPFNDWSSAALLPSADAGIPVSVSAHSATATQADRRTGETSSEFRFIVPGEPTPWARAGGGKSVVRFTPAKQRNYMGAVKLFCSAAMKGASPLDGPIAISVNAVYAWPASWNAKRRAQPNARWKISRPDLDNCSLKLLADALNTVAWTDDARICMAILRKYYGDFPQLEVSIRGL